MTTRIGLLMVVGFILAAITVCTIPSAMASCGTAQHFESGRIRLTYPSVISEDGAQDFLEDRERALEFAEEFLQTRLEQPLEITVNVSLLAASGGVWPSRSPTVTYNFPFLHLQSAEWQAKRGLAVHELVHVVDLYQWTLAASLALREGLAVAGDVAARPFSLLDPHLVCKGLLIENALIPLGNLLAINDRLSLTFAENQMLIYQEGASFVQFLIAQYGLSLFRDFYKVSYLPVASLQEEARQTYGKDLSSLEEEWLRFLRGYALVEELRAQHTAEVLQAVDTRIVMPLEQLESYWKRASFELVSPSEKVQREYDTFLDSMFIMGRPSDDEGNADVMAEALARYNRAVAMLEASLSTWLEAIRTFEDVLGSMSTADVDDYGSLIASLEEAWERYQHVGDDATAERVGKFIAALQCVVEGTDAFASGAPEAAEELLLKASSLFAELGRPEMVNTVDHLLEVYRCVTP